MRKNTRDTCACSRRLDSGGTRGAGVTRTSGTGQDTTPRREGARRGGGWVAAWEPAGQRGVEVYQGVGF